MPFTIDDVAKSRSVNGRDEPISDEERRRICDEWNANEAEQAERQALEQARAARREELKLEAAADAFIDRLRSASPQQIKDYVQANVTDLPSAKIFLAKLACAVAYALSGGTDK